MRTISIRHLALAIGPLLVLGCGGGETAPGTPGTAGTSGTGTAGAAGTTASDAAGTGSVGACAQPTAASPLISDFSGTETTPVAMQANGGTDVWTVSPAGSAVVMAGELYASTTAGDWASMSAVIGGRAPCLDMSKYTGVQFKIKSATNTSLIFLVATPETKTDFSHMRKTITVGTAYAEVSVPFAQLERAPFGAGMTLPMDYKPEQHMFAIAFGVGVMTELLDVYLDDVTFY